MFGAERKFSSAHDRSTRSRTVMGVEHFKKVVGIPRLLFIPQSLKFRIVREFIAQTVGFGIPGKNELSARGGARYCGRLFGKSARPERLQIDNIHGFQFQVMAHVAILVVMLGAQNHVAKEGEVVVFVNVTGFGLFGDRAENHYLPACLFEFGEVEVEKRTWSGVGTLKAAKKERAFSGVQSPDTAPGTAGHGQPLQI